MTVFPDTNILLHYPGLKDLDWRTIAQAQSVKLVICIQVIDELDKKKSDSRLASRAQSAIKEITGITSSGQPVREGVSLEIFGQSLSAAEFPASVNPDIGDERIIQLVKKYIDTTGETAMAVCTEDLGMRLRCTANGLVAIEPDKATRLENPQSEVERKYKEAITQLNAIKSAAPVVEFGFLPAEGEIGTSAARRPIVFRSFQQPQPEDVEKAVAEERGKREIVVPSGERGLTLSIMSSQFDDDEVREYGIKLERYLGNFRLWVTKMNEFKRSLGRLFRFRIEVRNSGRSPANDLNGVVRFPPQLQFISDGDRGCGQMMHAAPTQPRPPQRPQTRLEQFRATAALANSRFDRLVMPEMRRLVPRNDPSCEFFGEADDGFEIRFSIPCLLHHASHVFADFYSMFRSRDVAKTFQAHVAMTASNIPEKIERKVPFMVEVDDADCK